eukprot:TRINITY_DN21006_c0_g1_i1.p1 TRINITY_DN21006_c0_g1~~TRINITY_DN21006_c0_g1_i1.p1  ORF type:complete len:934 (+),score=113.87 TRINITY_DN21006_c0_g1_i1:40-2802(+)
MRVQRRHTPRFRITRYKLLLAFFIFVTALQLLLWAASHRSRGRLAAARTEAFDAALVAETDPVLVQILPHQRPAPAPLTTPLVNEDTTTTAAPDEAVTIIIPLLASSPSRLADCLEAVRSRIRVPRWEVVLVVTPGAVLPSTSALQDPSFRTIAFPENLNTTWSRVVEFGARAARHPVLVFLSPQVVPRNDVVTHLVMALNGNVGIAGCRTVTEATGQADGERRLLVVDHGFDTSAPDTEGFVLYPRLWGYDAHDARIRPGRTQSVLGASPLCFAARAPVLALLARKAAESVPLAPPTDVSLEPAQSLWHLSLLSLGEGLHTVATAAMVHVAAGDLPPWAIKSATQFGVADYMLHPSFVDRWRTKLRAQFFNGSVEADQTHRLRVFWDTFCVKCFGFTNEVVHFVVPMELYGHYSLRLVPDGGSCFCDGFPGSVQQSLRRLSRNKGFERSWRGQPALSDPDDVIVWISHKDPGSYSYFPNSLVARRPDYIIGRSMFEYSRFPREWLARCNNDDIVDEIWVPSRHVSSLFTDSGVNPQKLVEVPEALDTDLYDPEVTPPLALPEDIGRLKWSNAATPQPQSHWFWAAAAPRANNYKFLSMFKWEGRKGWDVLLEAYFREFNPYEPVSLYLLTYIWGGDDSRNPNRILRMVEDFAHEKLGVSSKAFLPHVHIITEAVAETDLVRLYRSVDCFVLPTRGEGWGLPIIQAMAMGLPAIATNWSGNLDFMRQSNSYLLSAKVGRVPDSNDPSQMWAQPSVDHLRHLMRSVVRDPDSARAVGARARADVVRDYSEPAVLNTVRRRLDLIKGKVLLKRAMLEAERTAKKKEEEKKAQLALVPHVGAPNSGNATNKSKELQQELPCLPGSACVKVANTSVLAETARKNTTVGEGNTSLAENIATKTAEVRRVIEQLFHKWTRSSLAVT